MNPDVFTVQDIRGLRMAARFLRTRELTLPDEAHPKLHQGVLTAALWLDHEADALGAAPPTPSRDTRRPIFNQLVAPQAGGLVHPDQAKAMLDAHETAIRAETQSPAAEELHRIKGALLELHPKTAEPRHGCCTPPKLCNGHKPECRSREHTIGGQVP